MTKSRIVPGTVIDGFTIGEQVHSGGMATLLPGHRDPGNAAHRDEVAALWGVDAMPDQPGKTAVELFQAAARGRQPDAMFNLAVMLAQGQGGDKDLAAAYAWCALAKSQGHEQAAAALPAIAAKLSPEDKVRADAMLKPAPKKS